MASKLNGETKDILAENIEKMKVLFPEAFEEEMIDFDKLKQILGEYVDDSSERYCFTWNGKGKALRGSQMPSKATLRPCKEESKDWETTQNLYIEGDNLEVLKLLQKSYYGKVKMIYIDPPYNTGGDFVYKDDFKESVENYKRITGQIDAEGRMVTTNTESSGRYHTDWLNMIYSRLRLARNLLSDDGVIFISIDDHEQGNLKTVCSELFGEKNFLAQIIWERAFSPVNLKKHFSESHDYILCYAKNSDVLICNGLPRTKESNDRYSNPDNDSRGVWTSGDLSVGPRVESNVYEIETPSGRKVLPPSGYSWRLDRKTFEEYKKDNKIWFGEKGDNVPRIKRFLADVKQGITPMTIWKYQDVGHSQSASQALKSLFGNKSYFEYPKPTGLIERCIQLYTKEDSVILDFFSGSATTAHAVMNQNAIDGGSRRYIMVQLPESSNEKSEAFKDGYFDICKIGEKRICLAGEKIKADIEEQNSQLEIGNDMKLCPDIGFKVFKLDSSNIKEWQPDYDVFEQTLTDSLNNFVEGRTEEDVVYEIMLKMGLDLTYPVEEIEVEGKKVYSIGFGALMICLDNNITTEVAEEMVKIFNEQQPETWKVVFKDNGFEDDSAKTNIKEILKLAGLEEDAFTTI